VENDSPKDRFSRRGFLGVGSAALATVAGSLAVSSAIAQENPAVKSGTDRSATDPGPSNEPLDTKNRDSAWPPATDSKSLVQAFKYPFSFANKRTYEGGWSREVTVRELPVSKDLAGVNMRLTAGGYISGKARMTVVSTGNKARTMDFQAGDVGYVEKTLLHYIENTGDTDLIFLEMFKSSFYQDLSLSEWLAHTPPELVMAHLNIDKATFDAIPKDELVVVPR